MSQKESLWSGGYTDTTQILPYAQTRQKMLRKHDLRSQEVILDINKFAVLINPNQPSVSATQNEL